MFAMRKNSYVACAWIFEASHANVFATLSREPGALWRLYINTRLFVDDKLHDSADERTKFGIQFDAAFSPTQAQHAAEQTLLKYAEVVLGKSHKRTCIEIHGDVLKAVEEMNKHPSIHLRMEGAPQA